MEPTLEFDLPAYRRINQAREFWLRHVIAQLPFRRELQTALDVGCGAGHFAGVLRELGTTVTGIDLQEENIRVCRERYPGLAFHPVNLDEPFQIPPYDLVLLFGILYHLQSPLQTIERLGRAIGRLAIIESRVAPGNKPALYLFQEHEGPAHNTARVTAVPTLPALLAMFRQAGLDYLYLPAEQPDHPEWQGPKRTNGKRYSFIAARESIPVDGWRLLRPVEFLKKWQPLHLGEKIRRSLARVLPFLG
jgi:SAM-dependent methyltransferase